MVGLFRRSAMHTYAPHRRTAHSAPASEFAIFRLRSFGVMEAAPPSRFGRIAFGRPHCVPLGFPRWAAFGAHRPLSEGAPTSVPGCAPLHGLGLWSLESVVGPRMCA